MIRFVFFILVLCLSGTSSLLAQEPVTVESLRALPEIKNPALSPDGNLLLFTRTLNNVPENKKETTIALYSFQNKAQANLINGVSDAQWSPDGKWVSFRATYNNTYGIYKAKLEKKGEKYELAKPILLAPVHTSNHFLGHPTRKNYQWSPDGQYIAYVSADPATCEKDRDPNAPLVVERTMYKSRTAFSDNCIIKVYLVEANGGTPKIITPGNHDTHSISWAPDSKSLVFLSNRSEEPDHNYNNEIYKVEISTGKTTKLTNTIGTEHFPVWSPKGDWIAHPATRRAINTKDSPPENTFIYGLSSDGKTTLNFTEALDRRSTSPQWHPKGEWLYFRARDKGKSCIYRVKKGAKPESVICIEGSAGNFTVGTNKLVYTYNAAGQPTEIYTANLDGSNAKRLTQETKAWTSKHTLAKVEDFWVESFDGTPVQGFVAYPANISNSTKLPVVHRIHGGPHGMYGFSFSDFNELLVAAGYAVVFINPRGSTGYGQKFADGTYQAWGGGDYKDLMAGLDGALEKFKFLDKDRMAVTGGSYGGFMTNWVVTQTNRYKAAITVASVSNLISFYGNSLYQLLIETEFNGMPWDNYSLLWHYSPMAHIKNVKTPTLLLHGEDDIDVPITQAEEFYIGLRKLEVPTRFVRYPNEGHGVRQPQHREHYYNEILTWLNKYISAKP